MVTGGQGGVGAVARRAAIAPVVGPSLEGSVLLLSVVLLLHDSIYIA